MIKDIDELDNVKYVLENANIIVKFIHKYQHVSLRKIQKARGLKDMVLPILQPRKKILTKQPKF